MNKSFFPLFLTGFFLAGCAFTSSHSNGPNGRPVHYIDGISARSAYAKAGELCPDGYTIIGNPEMKTAVDYVMTIECKAPRAVATPQKTATTSPRNEVATSGKHAYTVEHMPEVRNCNSEPVAKLIFKGPGVENYAVSCTRGDPLYVQCGSLSGCQLLQASQ